MATPTAYEYLNSIIEMAVKTRDRVCRAGLKDDRDTNLVADLRRIDDDVLDVYDSLALAVDDLKD